MTTPTQLAAVLGDDKVLIAARDLVEAEFRARRARVAPNRDTFDNGQPTKRELHLAKNEADRAAEAVSEAVRRAAERLALKEVKV